MTTKIEGSPLWGSTRKYKCGCYVIEGKPVCPRHNEPLQEQMIYGNDKIGDVNERNRYKEENLNEGS